MPRPDQLVSQLYITIDGNVVQSSEIQYMIEATVDQHAHLPDMFTLRLHDPELKLLDSKQFDLTKPVKIEAVTREGEKITLMEGEITALEPEFDEGMIATLVVRGYDKSFRLYRQAKSIAHQNKKDSDLAEEIARNVGLKAEVENTSIVYDHIYQCNQSDLAFLLQRAWRIGYECFVSEGTLSFRKPPTEGSALTLTWGEDLLSFQPCMTLAEQVDEVVVKGWDPASLAPIVGRAEKGSLHPKIEDEKDGATWAQPLGAGKRVIVDQPVASQAEAATIAAARMDEISGAFLEARGIAYRRPDIRAGRIVKIESLGKRFSGEYLVTQVTHVFSAENFKTTFYVRGSRTGLLAEDHLKGSPAERWPGVVTALVTNTDDPKGWGRVKVKYPWMADDAESDWARLSVVGGGPNAGVAAIPAVGDEVVMAFAHGDFSQPFVLGGLWNGRHGTPAETQQAKQGEKPLVRSWRSRNGHMITMHDTDDNKIEIKTAKGYNIVLDDKNEDIVITGPGKLKINMNRDITIDGAANLKLKTTGEMSIESNQALNFKAPQLVLEGTAQTTIKAATISIDGSAITEIKGGLVKIN